MLSALKTAASSINAVFRRATIVECSATRGSRRHPHKVIIATGFRGVPMVAALFVEESHPEPKPGDRVIFKTRPLDPVHFGVDKAINGLRIL